MMKYIDARDYKVEVGGLPQSSFAEYLAQYDKSKKVIIVDENTHEHCLSYLITTFEALSEAEVILLPEGEDNKQLEVAFGVWEALTEYGVGRHDLIINLGGGMITDMGGFIASCFKRGVDFINIPTSLLAMVDASIGGKTGVNLGPFKNQIGVFSNPKAVYVDTSFLGTLPEIEVLSGVAEMLKHGLINNTELFSQVANQLNDLKSIDEDLLLKCIEVKNEVVLEDPLEGGLRKTLNFGHTIGHVIEGHYMSSLKLSHGHAIAIGMLLESLLSVELASLSQEEYLAIHQVITAVYDIPAFSDQDIQAMVSMLDNDKKNREGRILCCLLPKIGECKIDVAIEKNLFEQAFKAFQA